MYLPKFLLKQRICVLARNTGSPEHRINFWQKELALLSVEILVESENLIILTFECFPRKDSFYQHFSNILGYLLLNNHFHIILKNSHLKIFITVIHITHLKYARTLSWANIHINNIFRIRGKQKYRSLSKIAS